MIRAATTYLRWIRDRWRMRSQPGPEGNDDGIVIVLFHGLFRNRGEVESGVCDPQQGITVDFFAEFVESLLDHGVVVRRLEGAAQRPPRERTVVITFDDGYFNNLHALGVLERFQVPATFFISTGHVEEQKSFWWDVVYREAVKRGTSSGAIRRQIRDLKRLRAKELESRLAQWFGARALAPVSDADRPFTEAELAGFARSRYVCLGNHTRDHAILVHYDAPGIRAQIDAAQRYLVRVTGSAPKSIAYPNGDYDGRVVEIAESAGLELGVTVRSGLNLWPARTPMELRRVTVWDVPGAARQGSVLASASGSRVRVGEADPPRFRVRA